jgi:hypothetical protein
VALMRAASRAQARRGRLAYALLAVFALGLAATPALDVWVIWTPLYGVDAIVRIATAVAAVVAAIALPRLLRRS